MEGSNKEYARFHQAIPYHWLLRHRLRALPKVPRQGRLGLSGLWWTGFQVKAPVLWVFDLLRHKTWLGSLRWMLGVPLQTVWQWAAGVRFFCDPSTGFPQTSSHQKRRTLLLSGKTAPTHWDTKTLFGTLWRWPLQGILLPCHCPVSYRAFDKNGKGSWTNCPYSWCQITLQSPSDQARSRGR